MKKFIFDFFVKPYLRKFILEEKLVYGDPSKLSIHQTAVVNNALFNLMSGKITVEENVFFGHNVSILTGSHDVHKIGDDRKRAIVKEGRDIVIKKGAWIASNAMIIGPCVIGEHAVIAAGATVDKDVAAYTVVAGVPAKAIKVIPH